MIEVEDVLGRAHRFDRPPRRVVSLVPSLTETLFDIGAGPAVAGVTDFCIFPAEGVAALPRLGGTKNPRVCAIRALEPDLVYVNVEENLERDATAVSEFASVFATEPSSVDGVLDLLLDLGKIHGAEESALAWRDRISQEVARAREANRSFSFACPIWKGPWLWCGDDTYVSNLIATAGGRNVLVGEERYPRFSLDEILRRRPDVVFLPDEPYLFTATDAAELRALGLRVIGPFPGHLFTWHGTRTEKGLAFLREALG